MKNSLALTPYSKFHTYNVSISASGPDGLAQGGLSGAGKAPEHDEERVGGRVLGAGLDGVDVMLGVEQEAVSQQTSIKMLSQLTH